MRLGNFFPANKVHRAVALGIGGICLFSLLVCGWPRARLEVELRWEGAPSASGRVFWRKDGETFNEGESRKFSLAPGAERRVVIDPRSPLLGLHFSPVDAKGNLIIRRISLFGWPWARPLLTWIPRAQLQGVIAPIRDSYISADRDTTVVDVSVPGIRDGAVVLSAGGDDSIFYLQDLPLSLNEDLVFYRIFLCCGVLLSFVLLAYSRAGFSETFLAIASTGMALLTMFLFFAPLRRIIQAKPAQLFDSPYEIDIVDRRGNTVSSKTGPLQMVIDPFTVYRPFPSQRNDVVSIDARGFREGYGNRKLPAAFVVGGSGAFGAFAGSDAETFVALLNRRASEFQIINAGVPGWRAEQELGYMIHYLDRYTPKRYVSFSGWNEIFMAGSPPGGYQFVAIERRLDEFAQLKAGSGEAGADALVLTVNPAVVDKAIADFLIAEDRMAAFARARGALFTLVLQPALSTKKRISDEERGWLEQWKTVGWPSRPDFHDEYEKLARVTMAHCRQTAMDCIDLLHDPEFQESPDRLFVDPIHLSARGQELVAKKLAHLFR